MSSSAYNHSGSSKNHDRRKTQTEYSGNKRQSYQGSSSHNRDQQSEEAKRRKIYTRKYVQTPDAWEKYQKITKIGQGTFGEVFKAKKKNPTDKSTQEVAMKRVIMDHEKEGFPITALREIKILQTLNRKNATGVNGASGDDKDAPIGYDNVVQLLEVCRDISQTGADNKARPSVFLVFEFCSHDLHGLLTCKKVNFGAAEKKSIVQQMLQGLLYIHGRHIFHRDMKTANILVTSTGIVKLADFGLARPSYVTSSRQLTNKVVTLWYRPPELLLGEINYGNAVDMWGCGCIMAELWTNGTPILQGKEELSQLHQIVKLCGSIEESDWPAVKNLREWNKFKMEKSDRKIRTKYKTLIPDNLALSLLDEMLKLNPDKRISACQALDHCWFWEEPMPQQPDLKVINNQGSQFEFLGRQKKEAEHKKQREVEHNRRQVAGNNRTKPTGNFGMAEHTY